MTAKIFIPETCRVGFQEREDTFQKKLAYVIYYDSYGKLRKEKSWESWRHEPGGKLRHDYITKQDTFVTADVAPYDFKNVPTSGFVLNKGIRRYNWSHFGTNRSMIRIWDPRGIEVEITPENLVGLLMHTDCSKREVLDELVYAWSGTELMLLPCSSEEYVAARKFTKLQGQKVGAKELREGYTYATKQEERLVYLGFHKWYEQLNNWRRVKHVRAPKNRHVFCDLNGENFRYVSSVPTTVGAVVSETCHEQFATWVGNFLATKEASEIVSWDREPLSAEAWNKEWEVYGWQGNLPACAEIDGKVCEGVIAKKSVSSRYVYPYRPAGQTDVLTLGFNRRREILPDGATLYCDSGCRRPDQIDVTDRSIFFDLYAVFANGLRVKWG